MFSLDPLTGLPSQVTSIAIGSGLRGVTVDAQGRYLAVVRNGFTPEIVVCLLDSNGVPTAVDTDPVTFGVQGTVTGSNTVSLDVSPDGTALFAANLGDYTVTSYTVTPATGSLSNASVYAMPTKGPLNLRVHPNGNYLYVAGWTAGEILPYALGAGGALTSLAPSASDPLVRALAFDSTGEVLFATDDNYNLRVFAVNQVTGAIASAGVPAQTGVGFGAYTIGLAYR